MIRVRKVTNMVPVKLIMAQNIRRLMDEKHMSVADLSRAINVPYTTINDWLHGITYPRNDKIDILASYFNVDANSLRAGKIRYWQPDKLYVSRHLEGIPQIEPLIRVMDAYEDADPTTRYAVEELLGLR